MHVAHSDTPYAKQQIIFYFFGWIKENSLIEKRKSRNIEAREQLYSPRRATGIQPQRRGEKYTPSQPGTTRAQHEDGMSAVTFDNK